MEKETEFGQLWSANWRTTRRAEFSSSSVEEGEEIAGETHFAFAGVFVHAAWKFAPPPEYSDFSVTLWKEGYGKVAIPAPPFGGIEWQEKMELSCRWISAAVDMGENPMPALRRLWGKDVTYSRD